MALATSRLAGATGRTIAAFLALSAGALTGLRVALIMNAEIDGCITQLWFLNDANLCIYCGCPATKSRRQLRYSMLVATSARGARSAGSSQRRSARVGRQRCPKWRSRHAPQSMLTLVQLHLDTHSQPSSTFHQHPHSPASPRAPQLWHATPSCTRVVAYKAAKDQKRMRGYVAAEKRGTGRARPASKSHQPWREQG